MSDQDGGPVADPADPTPKQPSSGERRTERAPDAGDGVGPKRLPTTDDGRGFIWDPTPRDFPIDETGALGQAVQVVGDDGHSYIAEYVPAADGAGREVRYAVSVIEPKVPYEQRPTRGLLDTEQQMTARHYKAVFQPLDPDDPGSQLGAPDAPDDDPLHGVGVESWWRGSFSEQEVETLRADIEARGGSVTYQTQFRPI